MNTFRISDKSSNEGFYIEDNCPFCDSGYIDCESCDAGIATCKTCEGSGTYPNHDTECPDCEGDGEKDCIYCSGGGSVDCDHCDGGYYGFMGGKAYEIELPAGRYQSYVTYGEYDDYQKIAWLQGWVLFEHADKSYLANSGGDGQSWRLAWTFYSILDYIPFEVANRLNWSDRTLVTELQRQIIARESFISIHKKIVGLQEDANLLEKIKSIPVKFG